MAGRLEAFLFDFGGVFTDSPFTAVEDFGREIGADPRTVSAVVFGSYEHDGEHPWHRLERGELSLGEARELILGLGRERELEVDIYSLFARMAGNNGGAGTRGALVEAVRGLRRAGYRTGIITNNVREFGDGWRAMIPVDELFEFVVDSSHVGVRKPDPRIFALAIEELGGLDPSLCVFLDDHPANVEAARALGMHAIHVGPDPLQTVDAIERLIG